MDWFRHYHGMCTDPKLHKIARKTRVSRGLVIAAWCAILETASQADPRGCCEDIDEHSLAFMIDTNPGTAKRILDGIKTAGMIDDDDHVSAWSKRQRETDDVSTRVRRHRAKNRKSLKNNETDSECNVTVTHQNRTEQIDSSLRSESISPATPSTRKPRRVDKLDQLEVDSELERIAFENGRDAQLELERYRDWLASKGKRHKDYRAGFRNWLRSPYGRPQPQAGPKSIDEAFGCDMRGVTWGDLDDEDHQARGPSYEMLH